MKIITLTLSPAFDRFCTTKFIVNYRENLLEETYFAAGGKGINISRALHAAGIPSTAVALLGKSNGQIFADEVRSQGIELLPHWQEGRVRENITVTTVKGETRLSFPALGTTKEKIKEIFSTLELRAGDILTLTGRLPKGIETTDVIAQLLELKGRGVLLVIDSKSFGIKDLRTVRPWLVKPNKEEMFSYYPRGVDTRPKALLGARTLHSWGIENVMISIGSRGAVLYNNEGAFAFKAPHFKEIRSTVGAGDSAIAGFLAAHYQGLDSESKLRYAVAFGTAACLSDGTLPPDIDVAMDIAAKLKLDEIELVDHYDIEDI